MMLFSPLLPFRRLPLKTQNLKSSTICCRIISEVYPVTLFSLPIHTHPYASYYVVVNDIDVTASSAPLASNKATTPSDAATKSGLPLSTTAQAQTAPAVADDEDLDYVYDVFFHRPGTLQDYANVGNVGTLYVLPFFLSFLILGCLRNLWFCVCVILVFSTGLPASFGDPYESDSEDEPEDEADEDSNGMSLVFSLSPHSGFQLV